MCVGGESGDEQRLGSRGAVGEADLVKARQISGQPQRENKEGMEAQKICASSPSSPPQPP